jgi:hypothetical protein
MAVFDLTKTTEYRLEMADAIKASQRWFADLGYADADFDLKAWMIWQRRSDDEPECSGSKSIHVKT